jgi:hypothetical protein
MLQFETIEEPAERHGLHVLRNALVGVWLVVCALVLWPVTLLGLFFLGLSRLVQSPLARPR